MTRIDHNTKGWRDLNVTSGAPSYDKQITRKHEPEDSHYHRRKPAWAEIHSNQKEADSAVAEIVALGRRAVAIQLDTVNVGAFDVFVDRVRRALGGLGPSVSTIS